MKSNLFTFVYSFGVKSKVAGHKINTQKLVVFLIPTMNNPKGKKIFPFIIIPRSIKYLSINSTKEVKNFCTENCKTLLKEIKQDLVK